MEKFGTWLGWKSDEEYEQAVRSLQVGDTYLFNGGVAHVIVELEPAKVVVRSWFGCDSDGEPYQLGIGDCEEDNQEVVTKAGLQSSLMRTGPLFHNFPLYALVPIDERKRFIPKPWMCAACEARLLDNDRVKRTDEGEPVPGGICPECEADIEDSLNESQKRVQ